MARRRFRSLGDLRRYLAYVLNQYEAGECDEAKVKTVSYALNIMAAIIRDSDLEARITALEENQKNERGRK